MSLLDGLNGKVRQQLLDRVRPHEWLPGATTCSACRAKVGNAEEELAHRLELAYRYGKNKS